jgi:hypothetical protein
MKTKQTATNFFYIFCVVILTACGLPKEQEAATMDVQTRVARETGTAAIEQAVSNALTNAAPTSTLTPVPSTPTPTPIPQTPTPTPIPPTPTPEIQQYFTEEFENDGQYWPSFTVDGSGWGGALIAKEPSSEIQVRAGSGYYTINIDKTWQWVYATYTPFDYTRVRVDARIANQGSNMNFVSLICHYTEDVGW